MIAKKSSIYEIRITLNGSKPPIWRKLAVPADIPLGELHDVIQIAMGWTDSHLHHFILLDKATGRRRSGRYFVPLTDPMGGPIDMDGEDEDEFTLADLCPKVKSTLLYEYDFGDGWEHAIEVQKIIDGEPGVEYPICLGGKLACPPEDCGGVWGYYNLLEAVADSEHEDHEELREWLGDEFVPQAFDLEAVNAMLADWRKDA